VGLLRGLGIDEHDMMRACSGTYKLATQFSDWAHEGRDFWQPFGTEQIRIQGLSLFDVWFAERSAGRLLRPLHSYSPQWTASLAGKSPQSFSATSPIAESGQYGFHLEANALRDWFRSLAIRMGVEESPGEIAQVFPNGRGGIAQVKLSDGKAVPGDLFLDCRQPTDATGLIDWSDQFPCDRVVSFRTARQRQVPPFTRITAQPAGWSQAIPLATETNYSYAFSSHSTSNDEAKQQLKSSIGTKKNGDDETAATLVDLRHGCRETFWKDNVIHIGQSACQLEPLASTDLHLHHAGIELLLELFPDRNVGRATRDEFNSRMTSITAEFRDLVQMHYVISSRTDTDFRRAAQGVPRSKRLTQLLEVYDATGCVRVDNAESMPGSFSQALLAGCGRLPKRPSLSTRRLDTGYVQETLRAIVKQNEAVVKDLPLHEELLDWIHTGPFQQQANIA